MEHTLGGMSLLLKKKVPTVLILVLVEHTLGALDGFFYLQLKRVLILVLVEHTLGGRRKLRYHAKEVGLNPCFSGTYSRSAANKVPTKVQRS